MAGGLDIATLGLRVDASGIRAGTEALGGLARQSEVTEVKVHDLEGAMQRATTAALREAEAVRQATTATSQNERAVTSAARASINWTNSVQARVRATQEAAAREAASVQASVAQQMAARQALIRSIQGTATATNTLTTATTAGGAGLSRLREPLTSLTIAAAGSHSQLTQVASIMGSFAFGSAIVVAALAGITAIAFAWRGVTEDSRNAKAAQEAALESLRRFNEERRRSDIGQSGVIGEDIANARSGMARTSRAFNVANLIVGNAPELRALGGDWLLDRLSRSYADQSAIVAAGERNKTEIVREESEKRIEQGHREAVERARAAQAEAAMIAAAALQLNIANISPDGLSRRATPNIFGPGGYVTGYSSGAVGGRSLGRSNMGISDDTRRAAEALAAAQEQAAQASREYGSALQTIATVAPESIRGILLLSAGIKELSVAFSAASFIGVAAAIYGSGNRRLQDTKAQIDANVAQGRALNAITAAGGQAFPGLSDATGAANERRRAEAEQLRLEAERARLQAEAWAEESRQWYQRVILAQQERRAVEDGIRLRTLVISGMEEEARALERQIELREATDAYGDSMSVLLRELYAAEDAARAAAQAEAALNQERRNAVAQRDFWNQVDRARGTQPDWYSQWQGTWQPILDESLNLADSGAISQSQYLALWAEAQADMERRRQAASAATGPDLNAVALESAHAMNAGQGRESEVVRGTRFATETQAARLSDINLMQLAELRAIRRILERGAGSLASAIDESLGWKTANSNRVGNGNTEVVV